MINKFFKDTVEILRLQTVIDANKVSKKSYQLVNTVKGLLQGMSGNKLLVNDKNEIIANYQLFLPTNTELFSNDVIRIDKKEYEIKNIDNTLRTHIEVLVKNK